MDLLMSCLDPSTEKALKKTFLQEFIQAHAESLLKMDSGLVNQIKYENYEEIGMMYDLYKMVPDAFEMLKRHL